jgi:hypothetical protein
MTFMTNEADYQTLWNMLRVRRPAGSKSERRFIRDFLHPLGLNEDGGGNLWKRIGDDPIMWSCHTDTVHKDGGEQKIQMKDGFISIARSGASNCLGADDGAGIWLMREMILAERPGLYIFHREEEHGGVGSRYLTKNEKEIVSGIQAAIAFDRRGTTNVITHQAGGRCCSDDFGKSLARALNQDGLALNYETCPDGIFTDTANYTDLIGECTNVSVGYYGEHTSTECLSYGHILSLRQALMNVRLDQLVVSRKPGEFDPDDLEDYMGWRYGGYGSNFTTYTTSQRGKVPKKSFNPSPFGDEEEEVESMSIWDMVQEFPDAVADFLEHHSGEEELRRFIMESYGMNRRSRYRR